MLKPQNVEAALGSSRRILEHEELKKRDAIRRSIFISEDVKSGTKLKDVSVEFRRPAMVLVPTIMKPC